MLKAAADILIRRCSSVKPIHRIDCFEVLHMRWKRKWVLFYVLTILSVLAASWWGSRTATVIAENSAITRKHRIIIDPGHGGMDGGATSCTGKTESSYNLEISQRLNALLQLMGYQTYMVRTADTSVHTKGETIAQKKASDLKERVRIANETENSILLSIHQNHFSDSRYSGSQVFYAGTEGSKELAIQLQSAFQSALGQSPNRQVKKSDGIYLMEHIRCPGVLIECGFLSNTQEEAKLRDPAYQKKLCCVIASTVNQHLSNT